MKRFVSIVFAAVLLCSIAAPMQKASAAPEIDINAKASILVEASTGKILHADNIDEKLPIASMAKVMTEYLVMEAIEEGKLKWDDTYTPDEYVHNISQDTSLSNVPLRLDGSYTVKELFDAMVIYSANGAAIALAEKVAGSESKFVALMNEKAKELGLQNYEFVNATGLENKDLLGMHPEGTKPEDENKLSARDMALLSMRLIQDYPEILEVSSIPRKTFKEGTEMPNYNWMLEGLIFEEEGVDGLKTGSTDSAGSSFTATADRNGMRVISVVMDANDGSGDLKTPRFKETKKLLNFAYNNFSIEEIFPAGYQMKDQSSLEVIKGKEKEVEIETKEAMEIPILNGEKENYKPKFVIDEKKLDENGALTAPFKKGEKVGNVTVEYTGKSKDHGFLADNATGTADIVTKTGVEKANWFVLSMRGVGGFFGGLWNSTVDTVQGWF
nr:serine hydrolase [Metabacillus arenae]